MLSVSNLKSSKIRDYAAGPPTTGGGGGGGHGHSTFLQRNAIPKFVDNRFNSLYNPMLI